MQVSEEYTVCLLRNAELSAYVESSDEEDFPPVPWSIPHQFRTAGNSLGARQPTSVKGVGETFEKSQYAIPERCLRFS